MNFSDMADHIEIFVLLGLMVYAVYNFIAGMWARRKGKTTGS